MYSYIDLRAVACTHTRDLSKAIITTSAGNIRIHTKLAVIIMADFQLMHCMQGVGERLFQNISDSVIKKKLN